MTEQPETLPDLTRRVSDITGGNPDAAGRITVTGPRYVLASRFDVTGLAVASVGAATLAAAEFLAARNATAVPAATVDSRAACAAFAAEGLFTPVGWSRPELWDPIAGNYQAADGWIRLHTNYAYHRAAVERVLGAGERDAVRAAVRRWNATDLETAVVAAGGCAAVMHTRDAWLASAAGAAAEGAPVLSVAERPARADPAAVVPPVSVPPVSVPAGRPFAGVRVLDLTRVIAGPACTRFLAAYGADVLRIDPPGFAEVPALLPETTAGKRTAFLDLRAESGRDTFEALLASADVLVSGLRDGALARLGYDDDTLAERNPGLIHASLNAYGWAGPWRERRGFDSLVQLSSGIAAAEAEAAGSGSDQPAALPVQALDHGCGYLLAALVGRALTRRLTAGRASRIRGSLTGTAKLLWSLPAPEWQPPRPQPADFELVDSGTAWGPARRAVFPGSIAAVAPGLAVEAGPLGRHEPEWAAR